MLFILLSTSVVIAVALEEPKKEPTTEEEITEIELSEDNIYF